MTTDAYARDDDPDTSHAAAESMEDSDLEMFVCINLRVRGPGTSEDIAIRTGIAVNSISPRLKPLLEKGLVKIIGKKANRSGRMALVWAAETKPSEVERNDDVQLPNPFNAFDFDPTQGTSVCLPLADYKVEITGAEAKVVKDNPAAGYLELSLTVTDGEARGLIQKDRLNLFNPSEVAKRIAHQQLAAYCFAINRPYIQDTDQLMGGRLITTIGPQEDNPKYSHVKVIKCLDGSLPTKQQAQGAQPAAQMAPPQAPPGFAPPAQATPAWTGQPPMQAAPPPASVQQAPPWGNQVAPQQVNAAPVQTPPWARQ